MRACWACLPPTIATPPAHGEPLLPRVQYNYACSLFESILTLPIEAMTAAATRRALEEESEVCVRSAGVCVRAYQLALALARCVRV